MTTDETSPEKRDDSETQDQTVPHGQPVMQNSVGYRRPPVDTQFKKGQSGNKKGRPKAQKNLATILRESANERIEVSINGKKKRLTQIEAVVLRTWNQALQGDARARAMLMKLFGQLPGEAPQELPNGSGGVAFFSSPCVTHEEWMIRHGSDFRFSFEGIDEFERGVREQCEIWRKELRERQEWEATLEDIVGEKFNGLPTPGNPTPRRKD